VRWCLHSLASRSYQTPCPAVTVSPTCTCHHTACTACSELQQLQEENIQLREDIQYLQHLLSVWQPQACSICQLHATSSSCSSKGTRSRAPVTPSRDVNGAAYAAVDRILRQQQVMVAQQQRQLLALQVCTGASVDLKLNAAPCTTWCLACLIYRTSWMSIQIDSKCYVCCVTYSGDTYSGGVCCVTHRWSSPAVSSLCWKQKLCWPKQTAGSQLWLHGPANTLPAHSCSPPCRHRSAHQHQAA
jgi:hypothetical protein